MHSEDCMSGEVEYNFLTHDHNWIVVEESMEKKDLYWLNSIAKG